MKTRSLIGPLLAVLLLLLPVGAAAQSPIASLSVDSGSGLPGATGISLPVSLSSQGGALVNGVNFDLTFDSNRLAIAGVTIGSAASSVGKGFGWSQPSGNRIRVIIYDMSGANTPIPDGTVTVVTFNVLSNAAPGTSSLSLGNAVAASPPPITSIPADTTNGTFDVLAPPATNTATATSTPSPTRTCTPTATSSGPTDTRTPTPTRTRTATPGGPTNTAVPTNTAGPATLTRTPTVSGTPLGTQALTPAETPTALPGSTRGADEDPSATETAQAATAAAEFEAAVAGTATALAELDAAVRATATALAGGDAGPTPESGRGAPRPEVSGPLLVVSAALALIALGSLFAFIVLRRRR
jgi:hypothetical protein